MGFSRQEYCSGLPFLSPGDFPDPGIEPRSPILQADALTSEPPGKSQTGVKSWLCYMRLCYGSAISYVMVMLWLLHQSGENKFAVPMAPRVSFQPLSLCLAYPGFNKQCTQCEQQDNWHYKQDQQNRGTAFCLSVLSTKFTAGCEYFADTLHYIKKFPSSLTF